MDNVLVIGGAGFIGKVLTAELAESGATVTVVSRSAGSRRDAGRVRYAEGDVTDATRMMQIVAGATIVYDLSTSLGATWEECERYTVGGARNVAEACLAHGVRRLIYTSSISALYLGASGSIDESAGPDAKPNERGNYGKSKIYAERMLLDLHATRGLPVTIFRPGIVLGRGGVLVHAALGDKASPTCILGFGPGTHPLPCVLVEDVAHALYLAKAALGIEGLILNLAGDVRPTAREYVQLLREQTRRNYRYYPRSIAGMILAERFRWTLKALARKPDNMMLPPRETRSAAMATDLDCSLAKQKLGWQPVASRDEFIRRALTCHIAPIPPGDLRLQ